MNTPAHTLMAAALFARPGAPLRNSALIIGSLVPDLLIFWMVFWEGSVNGLTEAQIFGEAYFSAHWQAMFAQSNSIPLYAGLAALGLALKRDWIWVFGGAAAVHCVFDLFLHHDDGRAHFWPFSDWVFESPVSYWDPGHYGLIAGPLEALIACGFAWLLYQRFSSVTVHVVVALVLAIEIVFAVGGPLLFG